MDGIEDKAKASGATKCIVKDLREEFVRDYVYDDLQDRCYLRRAITC